MSGGGGVLSEWLHEVVIDGADPALHDADFRLAAREIITQGAVGFGEMAALHLSYQSSHPFIEIPPNHDLFLALSEVAVEYEVPLDIHLELIDHEQIDKDGVFDLPADLAGVSPGGGPCFSSTESGGLNPTALSPNRAAFEELLDHAYAYACDTFGDCERSRLVWSHVGWDNIGHMTLTVLEEMLAAHPNLVLSLKALDSPQGCQDPDNAPLEEGDDGGLVLKAAWADFISANDDRVVLGGDEFMGSKAENSVGSPSTVGTWTIVEGLGLGTAETVACSNVKRLYGVPAP